MKEIIELINKHKSQCETRTYKKGETIFYENELCEKIGVVKKGEISIKSYFSDGKEVTYNILTAGQMFGNNLVFSSNPFYRGDVIALENSEICFLDKNELVKILKTDDEFLVAYLTRQSDFSKTLNFKIKLLTISSAEDRLIYYLTFNKNKIMYKSITKLANELYLTRESLSRTIKKLADKRVIKHSGKNIELVVQYHN